MLKVASCPLSCVNPRDHARDAAAVAQQPGTTLLAQQLDFCAHTVAQLPVKELLYPLEPGVLEEEKQCLRKDLQ